MSSLMRPILFFFGLIAFLNADAEAAPASPDDACLPISMPTADAIFSAKKKVFAHYFSRFPLSLDNKPWTDDYYATGYLSETGEHNKWLDHGGFLRSRPLPVFPGTPSGYKVENLKREIRLALSRGISGFTFDLLSLKDLEPRSYLANMLEAAAAVDPRFKIILMPDMSAFKGDTDKVYTVVKALYHTAGLYHTADGKLVVVPFLAESVSPATWGALKTRLASEGYPIVFIPTFLSLKTDYVRDYQGASDALGTFGTPVIRQGTYIPTDTAAAHKAGKLYMAGISGQGYRPKNFIYWEANGSLAYRNGWQGAIDGGADWVQVTTWNDYSESTQIIPYTDMNGSAGSGYFDLTGYYASWFITGQQPAIIHDVLYYFYRREPVSAVAAKDQKPTVANPAGGLGSDTIELLGFLTAPGTLVISVDGHDYQSSVASGMQSFRIPSVAGTPHFALIRDNRAVIAFDGAPAIMGPSGLANGHMDLTYWSGSASAEARCTPDMLTGTEKTTRN